jgi:hypothetical protein
MKIFAHLRLVWGFGLHPFLEKTTGYLTSFNTGGTPEHTFFTHFTKLQQLITYVNLNPDMTLTFDQKSLLTNFIDLDDTSDDVIMTTNEVVHKNWRAHQSAINCDSFLGDEYCPIVMRVFEENVRMSSSQVALYTKQLVHLYSKCIDYKFVRIKQTMITCTHIGWFGEQLCNHEHASGYSSYVFVNFKADDEKIYSHAAQILKFVEFDVECVSTDTKNTRISAHRFAHVRWFKQYRPNVWLSNEFEPSSFNDIIPIQRINCRFAQYYPHEHHGAILKAQRIPSILPSLFTLLL